MRQEDKQLQNLTRIFHTVAECSQDVHEQPTPEPEDIEEEPIGTIAEEETEEDETPNTPPVESKGAEMPRKQSIEALIEEDHALAQLNQNIIEEGYKHPPSIGLFANGSLINSIENEMGVHCIENPTALSNSVLNLVSSKEVKKFDTTQYKLPTCPLEFTEDLAEASGVNKNQSLRDENGKMLYQPYRTDTCQLDESIQEYTDYSRETLV